MFLRRHQRTVGGKRHTYFSLVESYRSASGPRQRVVAHLGELSEDDARRWRRTAVLHGGHCDAERPTLFDEAGGGPAGRAADRGPEAGGEVLRVRVDDVSWTNGRSFGDVWLGAELWRLVGLDEIMARHLPHGRETVPPATMVAIEVISRLCIAHGGPTSELGLAEHGYRRTALEDLLGVPDAVVTKDRLYRTLDALLAAKSRIEVDLKERLGTLFSLDYDLLLCDLTSSFFEGLAEDNELAARGHSRDHRSDCAQVVLAMVVTHDGFPLHHEVFRGNTRDSVAFVEILRRMEGHFGKARRIWVLDRGIATEENLRKLREQGQSFLVGTPRSRLGEFEAELCTADWTRVRESVEVKCVVRGGESHVLARSRQRRRKERAIRHRQLVGARKELRKLSATVAKGRLRDADKALERVGRIRQRWPAASRFVEVDVRRDEAGQAATVAWRWRRDRLRTAMARDGAYLLLSDQTDWPPEKLWTTYIQLTRAEDAFRAMKSSLLLRPMWHQIDRRVEAHIFVCVLAYALWKALEHRLGNARAITRIRKKDPRWGRASPQDRPMSPLVALRIMHGVQVGDIVLRTVEGREVRLRRVARPDAEQAELLAWLGMELPERLRADARLPDPPSGGSEGVEM